MTQFEALTAAAFHALAAAGVDVAVIEAGLGGRYDATNVIPSKVQVLTSVGLDHTRWLGDTVADIAAEKLAVVRDHATLVIPPDLAPEAVPVAARGRGGARTRTSSRAQRDLGVPLAARGALPAAQLRARRRGRRGVPRAPARPRRGRGGRRGGHACPGRMEVVGEDPLVILDGAHNGAGAAALADALPELVGDRPLTARHLDPRRQGRGGDARRAPAAGRERRLHPHVEPARAAAGHAASHLAGRPDAVDGRPTRSAALERARELAGPGGAVLATGSIYLIADLVRRARPGARASMI